MPDVKKLLEEALGYIEDEWKSREGRDLTGTGLIARMREALSLDGWVNDRLPPKETKVLLCFNLGWDEPKTIETTFEVCDTTEDDDGNPIDLLLPVDEHGESLEFDSDTEWAWRHLERPALGKWLAVEHVVLPSPPEES